MATGPHEVDLIDGMHTCIALLALLSSNVPFLSLSSFPFSRFNSSPPLVVE